MIDRFKYVTFKREEFERLLSEMAGVDILDAVNKFQRIECADAVVIRKRDKFAAIALSSYAHAVVNVVTTLKAWGGHNVDTDHLMEIADYFAGEADNAEQMQGRLPD